MTSKRTLEEEDYVRLGAWGVAGARLVDATARLRMSPNTLRRIFADDERAVFAWSIGRSELHEVLVSKLIEKAKAGDVVAILFSLKAVFGYREGESLDGGEQRSLVTINLPAALPPEAYAKLVEVTPRPAAARVAAYSAVTDAEASGRGSTS